MTSETERKLPSVGPELRLVLSVAVAVLVLIATAACVLILVGAGANGQTAKATDSPTLRPPPTFTPTSTSAPTKPAPPTATNTPLPSPTPILVRWRELGDLAVVEYTGKTIAELEGKSWLGLGVEQFLLEVTGTVKVSVDLKQIQDSDVVVDGTSVTVVLPQPAVEEGVDIPANQRRVWVNKKWILFSDLPEDYQLEALDKAEQQLRDWIASDENWMDIARILAQRRLTVFLGQLGFEDIEIVFRESPWSD